LDEKDVRLTRKAEVQRLASVLAILIEGLAEPEQGIFWGGLTLAFYIKKGLFRSKALDA